MKKTLFFLLLCLATIAQAQVGIGTETPNASAILDVSSTTRGLLLPRMTTIQRDAIASPSAGLVIFNTTSNCLNMFTGVIWNELCGTATQGLIATLSCTPTDNGTLTANTAASSVSSVFSYTGGNNLTHNGQTVTSTGVTGLTATLTSGTMSSAGGTLTYNITGTPSGSGTASFAINIGGRTCTLNRTVLAVGTIATIACGSATNNGTLNSGTAASGVSSVISYTSGNGGTHSGQSVTSTGVTGLTATLSSGTFANGSGTLTYNITGTPSAAGTATFAINIGGQTCNLTRTAGAPVPTVVYCLGSATTVVDVVTATGRTWMDRNLGASQVATSVTDASAYGDLYQWGRGQDGHQCRNSSTTSTASSTDQPGHSLFITNNTDWRNPSVDNLWQGLNGINNPCPSGYRIPSLNEIIAEQEQFTTQNAIGAYNYMKLTVGGRRQSNNIIGNTDQGGFYWTSTIFTTGSTSARALTIDNTGSGSVSTAGGTSKHQGFSVRCIKNTFDVAIQSLFPVVNNGTLTAGVAASGVYSLFQYTGGNGSSHTGQTVTSTGVTGLTATLNSGNFLNGTGTNLQYNITGTPNAAGTAKFLINIGGQIYILSRTVN